MHGHELVGTVVSDAETHADLRNTLRRCRSRQQLLQAARHLGYRVTRTDLQNAWVEHQQGGEVAVQDAGLPSLAAEA